MEVSNLLVLKEQTASEVRSVLTVKPDEVDVIHISEWPTKDIADIAWHMENIVQFDG